MRQIVCFGDSNTYGLIPKTGGRYPWGVRWTSLLNEKLGPQKYRVIEEGLCGRTAEIIGKGIGKIISQIKSVSKGSRILLIAPIHLGEQVWEKEYDPEFSISSVDVSKGLAQVYESIAQNEGIDFLNAAAYAKPSSTDQEHLNEEGHRLLAEAVFRKISEMEENAIVRNTQSIPNAI